MQHTALLSSDAFTVLDCRRNKNISFKDMDPKTSFGFHKNDWNWVASGAGMKHTADRLSKLKDTFHIVFSLHDVYRGIDKTKKPIQDAIEQGLWKESPNHVNVMLNNNISTEHGHIPMTPWMALHRVIHCMHSSNTNRKDVTNFLNSIADVFTVAGGRSTGVEGYGWDIDGEFDAFFRPILTSRCARKKNINSSLDFASELFAQHYMGGVRFLRTKDWEERFIEVNPDYRSKNEQWIGGVRSSPSRGWQTIHKLFSTPNETDAMLAKLEQRVSDDIEKMTASLIGRTLSF